MPIVMKPTLVLVVAALLSAALSGCIFQAEEAGPDAADPSGPAASPSPSPDDSEDDETGTPSENDAAPLAAIDAANVTGETPFTVTFELTSPEPDARFLDWSFDADGDGTADDTGYGLPAESTFTYEEAGDHTARLTVTDSQGSVGNASLDITAIAPAPVIIPDPITFTGKVTGVSDNLGGYIFGGNENHTFNVSVPLNNITLTFEVGDTALDLDFTLLRPDGEQAERVADFNTPVGFVFPRAEPPIFEDDPADLEQFGIWTVVIHPYLAFDGEYTITVVFQ